MYSGRIWSYVCGRCCIYNRRSRGIFYLIYRIGECGVRCHWKLFVTINPLLQSMEGTCHGQVCIVVLVVHLVLSELAALVVCVAICMCCGAWNAPGDWSAPGAVNACCTGHMCWLYVVLGVHLVLSVLGDWKSLEFYEGHSPLATGTRQAPHNTYSQHIGALQASNIANTYAKCSKL